GYPEPVFVQKKRSVCIAVKRGLALPVMWNCDASGLPFLSAGCMTIHCRTSMVLAAGNLEFTCALAAVTKAIAKTTIKRNPIQRCMTSTPKTGWLSRRDALNLCQPGSAQFAREQPRTLIQQKVCDVFSREQKRGGTVWNLYWVSAIIGFQSS